MAFRRCCCLEASRRCCCGPWPLPWREIPLQTTLTMHQTRAAWPSLTPGMTVHDLASVQAKARGRGRQDAGMRGHSLKVLNLRWCLSPGDCIECVDFVVAALHAGCKVALRPCRPFRLPLHAGPPTKGHGRGVHAGGLDKSRVVPGVQHDQGAKMRTWEPEGPPTWCGGVVVQKRVWPFFQQGKKVGFEEWDLRAAPWKLPDVSQVKALEFLGPSAHSAKAHECRPVLA